MGFCEPSTSTGIHRAFRFQTSRKPVFSIKPWKFPFQQQPLRPTTFGSFSPFASFFVLCLRSFRMGCLFVSDPLLRIHAEEFFVLLLDLSWFQLIPTRCSSYRVCDFFFCFAQQTPAFPNRQPHPPHPSHRVCCAITLAWSRGGLYVLHLFSPVFIPFA